MSSSDIFASASIEVSARGRPIPELSEWWRPGSEVFLPWLPGDEAAHQVQVAKAVAQAGFHPVPHLAARRLASERDLDAFLAQAVGEASVSRLLVIAGDIDEPQGPFGSSLDVLVSGVPQRHGIKHIYVAGHPEGHQRVPREIMDEALRQKLAWGRQNGISMGVVTQFCFEAEPVIEWLTRFQGEFTEPARIGIAGPANPATLLKFALRCGVGNSVRALQRQAGRFTRLLTETAPDPLIDDLLGAAAAGKIHLPEFHIFPFGGVRTAARWIRAREAIQETGISNQS
jgi:methylenetetrahydrofolate reductase (NADPH)